MHDPMTVAFEIKYPWKTKLKMKDGSFRTSEYRDAFITIWHVDPETDGSDDSCGWFMRIRHENKKVLEKIIKAFEFDWDRTFTSENNTYNCGLFQPNGMPHLSVMGIGLNLFWRAALEVFNGNRDKAEKYIKKHLFDILFFAENPCDSMFDGFTLKFGNDTTREERIRNTAGMIYSYILRDIRPWYKHPKWHIHHWEIQIHPLQNLRRWLLTRCCKCGRRFRWKENACSDNWYNEKTPWYKGEKGLSCSTCNPCSCSENSKSSS